MQNSGSAESGSGFQQVLKRYTAGIVTTIVGVTVAFGLYFTAEGWEKERTQIDFRRSSMNRVLSIERGFANIVNGTAGFRGFYGGSGNIDAGEYAVFVKNDTLNYLGLEVMAWVPWVPESEREAVEASAEGNGVEDFEIDVSRAGTISANTVYCPVYYKEPSGSNLIEIGEDLYSDPEFTKTFNEARDRGAPRITHHLDRFVPYGEESMIGVISPIYRNGTPTETLRQRRENLAGFNVYLIDFGKMTESSLHYVDREIVSGIHHVFFDDAAEEQEALYNHFSRTTDGEFIKVDGYHRMDRVEVAGFGLQAHSYASPFLVERNATSQPLILFAVVLVFTLVTAGILISVMRKGEAVNQLAAQLERSHGELERRVDERTAELQSRNEEMERQQAELEKANEEMTRQQEELVKANREIQEQGQTLMEMSIPVIKIWEGIVLVPLIGVIDTTRASQMIERLLSAIVENSAEVALLDVTGVPVIDTSVARHIIQAVDAGRILGTEIVITGFSPEAAQTLAQIGVDFSQLRTRGSLRAGITDGFRMVGVKVS